MTMHGPVGKNGIDLTWHLYYAILPCIYSFIHAWMMIIMATIFLRYTTHIVVDNTVARTSNEYDNNQYIH